MKTTKNPKILESTIKIKLKKMKILEGFENFIFNFYTGKTLNLAPKRNPSMVRN
jgi:hypothetical protein